MIPLYETSLLESHNTLLDHGWFYDDTAKMYFHEALLFPSIVTLHQAVNIHNEMIDIMQDGTEYSTRH